MGNKRKTARRRPTKLKSVTFSGCLTCRARKVKCDERHGNGCGVCEKSELACQGYEVSLCWEGQHMQSYKRMKITPARLPIMPEDELGRTLFAIDAVTTPRGTVSIGPFAVFEVKQEISTERVLDKPILDNLCDNSSSPGNLIENDNASDVISCDEEYPHQDALQKTRKANNQPFTLCIGQSWSSPCEESLLTGLLERDPFDMSLDLGADEPMLPSPYEIVTFSFFRDRNTSMLMNHYINHVAELLQPILHPQNPWKTTYFPFALRGCSELFGNPDNSTSQHASTTLFHSLLSAAAFHLRNATGSTKFHQLGLQHRIKALAALNTATMQRNDPEGSTVYLAAMLSLVTIDTLTGEDSDFSIHLRASRRLRRIPQNDGRRVKHGYDSTVDGIYRFLSLLARTTARISPRPWSTEGSSFHEPYFREDERSVEYIYGVTPILGNLLQETCQVADHLSFYNQTGLKIPESLQETCQVLGKEIHGWNIDSEQFQLIEPEQKAMLEIAQCQARAFHRAVVIFYHRTIEGAGGAFHTITPIDVDSEVELICRDLTMAEDLKDSCMGGEKRAAPMSWPAFIAACESRDRKPWVEWWSRVQDYNIGNFIRQWEIIREIWNVLDANEGVFGWREALEQIRKPVLPI